MAEPSRTRLALARTEVEAGVENERLDVPVGDRVEDPNTFTRPWKISLPLYRHLEKNFQLLEFKCVEFSENLLYGEFLKVPPK